MASRTSKWRRGKAVYESFLEEDEDAPASKQSRTEYSDVGDKECNFDTDKRTSMGSTVTSGITILDTDSDLSDVDGTELNGDLSEVAESDLSDVSAVDGYEYLSDISDENGCVQSDSDMSDIGADGSQAEASLGGAAEPTLTEDLQALLTNHPVSHRFTNDLLKILKGHGHPELPSDRRTLLQAPRNINVIDKCGGKYIYLGLESGIRGLDLVHEGDIEVIFNADGLDLFKSSKVDIWPILGQVQDEVFAIALYSGKEKPEVGEFLEDFLEELSNLEQICINGVYHNLVVKAFCNDAPARSMLKCVKYHQGHYCCERCTIKGESIDYRMTYNDGIRYPSRNDAAFNTLDYLGEHQKAPSPLIGIRILCVKGFALDYMHLACIWVAKRILLFLKYGPSRCRMSGSQRVRYR